MIQPEETRPIRPKKPFYQKVIVCVSYVLIGALAIGNLFDAISNAITLVTPVVTYLGTAAIAIFAVLAEILLRLRPVSWVVSSGQMVRLRKLGIKSRFVLIGIIMLLWVPRIVAEFAVDPVEKITNSAVAITNVDSKEFDLAGQVREGDRGLSDVDIVEIGSGAATKSDSEGRFNLKVKWPADSPHRLRAFKNGFEPWEDYFEAGSPLIIELQRK